MKTKVYEDNQNASTDISKLQNLVKLLKSDLERMVNGLKILNLILGSQKPYLDKTRLGYVEEENEISSKDPQSKSPTCIYCFKKGYSSGTCFSRSIAR